MKGWFKMLTSVFLMSGTCVVFYGMPSNGLAAEPVIIGIDADFSSGSASAGEAIHRGALIAIAEINEKGGVLGGRKLELNLKDHHGSPTRSTDNLNDLSKEKNLVAVIGGLHSPAIIKNQDLIHRNRLIMLDPWAAATAVVENGKSPNYVFRVSVRDEYVGGFLVGQAVKQGYKNLGLLLEKTDWGRGNEKYITVALSKLGRKPASVQWFYLGDTDMTTQLIAFEKAGADAVIMVANAPEGGAIVRHMALRPEKVRLPIISHWGITGGNFRGSAGDGLKGVKLQFLQTYSFMNARGKKAREVINRYKTMFKAGSEREIMAPVGTAHAYDLVRILALAIDKAGTIDRAKVRNAMEKINSYSGLVKTYRPPFTPQRHEGLNASDYHLAIYDRDGTIMPRR
ncbi:ABC transporter substrate-binding protein [Geotalea toluenoxydans]|uniref:ABC transporter substrate-binding protein n=1 Tax=Geotalea toluenoxydans TaxID=421624 RepID=UPI0006D0F577|nr:ABC transporter substrate-binding protein [Geotalea toluenoxydans]